MSNVSEIVSFLRGKGLGDAAIAGILGNLQIESGFNPGAYNAGEGAIGIAQWEGGRRTALQSYARSHGGSETDLSMQLGYLWQELNSSESGALSSIRRASSAGEAAAIWDAQFERSSGAARSQRVAAAQSFFGSGLSDGGSGGSSGGGMAGASERLLTGGGTTRDDFAGVDSLGSLLDSIPELKALVDQAVSGDWTTTKFQNAVEDSKWWKSYSDTARTAIITKANDPATYGQDLNSTVARLMKLGDRLGMRLANSTALTIAQNALLTGNNANDEWLTDRIAAYHDYSHYGGVLPLQGELGATYAQLRELASAYGQNPGDAALAERAKHIVQGATTLDAAKADYASIAKSIFPGLSDQIDAGQTVAAIADPYVQSMANLLEVNPNTLGIMSTPLVRRALQGTSGTGKGTVPQVTPLWQFEQQVRQDPKWSYTDNAHKDMATLALQLGQTWGFG